MTREPIVYLNGTLVPLRDARVSVYDGGWLHGAGLFETMRAEYGRVFRLESHLTRLMRSAAVLLHPIERGELPGSRDFAELLRANGLETARVRLTVTSGTVLGEAEAPPPSPTVCVTASELFAYPQKLFDDGVSVLVSRYRQSPLDPTVGHKTTGYLARLAALREAQAANCAEAIWFTTAHQLAEGSISNVFVVRNGVLRTPALDTPVLPGIARDAVMSIAQTLKIPMEEGRLSIDDLLDADEVMLTNAMMEVLPVVRVEKHAIGNERVGPITRQLREAYRALVQKECSE